MASPESSTAEFAEMAQLLQRLWLRVSRSQARFDPDAQETVVDPDRDDAFADTVIEDRFRIVPSYRLN